MIEDYDRGHGTVWRWQPAASSSGITYNDKGRIRYAPDVRQGTDKPGRCNYGGYDKLGRSMETGEGLEPIFNPDRYLLAVFSGDRRDRTS